jgi:predicted MFS family arabinose efflux permease
MPAGKAASLKTLLLVLRLPVIKRVMISTVFVFIGYATFFTYLRPFLETVTHVDDGMLSIILLGFGLSNLAGTSLPGYLLRWNIYRTLSLMPFLMSLAVAGIVVFGNGTIAAVTLTALWKLFFGVVQVRWTTWLTRTVPDEAESFGGGSRLQSYNSAFLQGPA